MAIKLTEEQQLCIETKGNVLVAAAAGSGKTAVLVERVINKLCSPTDAVSADRLLIVTFTNAAAAEMRGRIEKRLDEECRKNPENTAILRQKHLLSSAKICTIDSFCIDLVRENFEKLGIAPDFNMSDGNSLRPHDENVMGRIIGKYLEENNQTFLELLDLIGAEYDDFNFLSFVLELYYYSRQLPFPTVWFESLSGFYNEKKFSNKSVWWEYSFSMAESALKDARDSIAQAVDLVSVSEKAADKYLPAFIKTAEMLSDLDEQVKKRDWDAVYNGLSSFIPPSLPRVNGVGDIFEVSAAKSIYKYIDEKLSEKLRRIFYANLDFINTQFKKIYEPLKLLSEILIEFEKEIFLEYLNLNTFTFHNTEQLALTLLCEYKEGEIAIKQEAEEFLNRFDEVMVDEYQDTNDLQDMLFYVLSAREKKLFVVGDVKQSIYGFRGANPKNFLKKKNRYHALSSADADDAKKIILSKNFRCKPDVCKFINYFFENFMSEETGDIIYNGEEALVPGAIYPETDFPANEFNLISRKGSEEADIILESRRIAQYIKEVMSSGEVIRKDDSTLRRANYSDFTILLRSVKNKGAVMAAELKKHGIPVNFSTETYAESYEISTVLSLLKIIDNPKSDIELISVMMSPIFGFTPEDMAKIKIENRKGDVYSAVIFSAENGNEKAKRFLKEIEKYRLFAAVSPLDKLISYLINDSGYMDIVSSMPFGSRRRSNLLLLCEYASQYAMNNSGGLGGFVRYILKQSENGIKSADSGILGDTVKIMSIHASKGLQFPICIVAGIGSDFNDSESGERTLYSTDLGIGFKYFDEESKQKRTTVAREIILERIRSARLEEELRLLYVAMTRTQDKLLFIGTVSDAQKKIDNIKTLLISSGSKITSSVFKRTKSYLDWLMLSLVIHPDGKEFRGNGSSIFVCPTESKIKISVIEAEDLPDISVEKVNNNPIPDFDIIKKIKDNIAYSYPFSDILNLESKASVSALANKAESEKYAFSGEPAFMSGGGITATGRGTAMHKVMQYFDFDKCDDIESEINRLYEWQFISETEADSINRKALEDFFKSDVFSRIKKSSLVKREMRFLTELSAKEIDKTLDDRFNDEKIIVQGAVDICFVEKDGIIILDFKTDRVDNINQLRDAYGEQLSIYAMACEKIFDKPLKEKIIYSFSLSKEISF